MNIEIMTIRELAAYLQIGQGKLYRLAQEGKIPATKIGRTWRFRKDLVDVWFLEISMQQPQSSLESAVDGELHKGRFASHPVVKGQRGL